MQAEIQEGYNRFQLLQHRYPFEKARNQGKEQENSFVNTAGCLEKFEETIQVKENGKVNFVMYEVIFEGV